MITAVWSSGSIPLFFSVSEFHINRIRMIPVVAKLFRQRHTAQIVRVPAWIKSTPQAFENQRRPADCRQSLVSIFRFGVNLNFNAARIDRIGGRARHQLPVPKNRHSQPAKAVICPVQKLRNKVLRPLFLCGLCINCLINGRKRIFRRQ